MIDQWRDLEEKMVEAVSRNHFWARRAQRVADQLQSVLVLLDNLYPDWHEHAPEAHEDAPGSADGWVEQWEYLWRREARENRDA